MSTSGHPWIWRSWHVALYSSGLLPPPCLLCSSALRGPSRSRRGARSSSGEEDLQKLFVHDKDRLLTKVTFYADPTSAGVETDEKGEWRFHPSWCTLHTQMLVQGLQIREEGRER